MATRQKIYAQGVFEKKRKQHYGTYNNGLFSAPLSNDWALCGPRNYLMLLLPVCRNLSAFRNGVVDLLLTGRTLVWKSDSNRITSLLSVRCRAISSGDRTCCYIIQCTINNKRDPPHKYIKITMNEMCRHVQRILAFFRLTTDIFHPKVVSLLTIKHVL